MKLLLFLQTILFFSCANNSENVMQKEIQMNLEYSKISHIELIQTDSKKNIVDSVIIKEIVLCLNSAKMQYIKFGSPNKFVIYDKENNILEQGFYRDSIFKIRSVVFKANKIIFE